MIFYRDYFINSYIAVKSGIVKVSADRGRISLAI